MDWGALQVVAKPWFVIPWYAVGVAAMAWVVHDVRAHNTPLKQAMKWAWPIIVLFFSVIGLALYFATARAPGIGGKRGDEAQEAHDAYEESMLRRVTGAVIHCVAGDGLGIMTGMVIARAIGMSFWQEFWFEYAVGFAFGWFIFQFKSMTMMTDSKLVALAMAFRAEFFSMLTVMAGMGAVMAYVTPLAVTAQPSPLTYAFWGFGMLGLLVGFVFTFPMNWMLVKMGWKHGMGGREGAHPVQQRGDKVALFGAMVSLGCVALLLPAWLAEVREGVRVPGDSPVAAAAGRIGPEVSPYAPTGAGSRQGRRRPSAAASPQARMPALAGGLRLSLRDAVVALGGGRRAPAMHAIEAAQRVADVGHAAAPGSGFGDALDAIQRARHALYMGDTGGAKSQLSSAADAAAALDPSALQSPAPPRNPEAFRGATLVDATGVRIGEVTRIDGDIAELALGGDRDVFGFVDLGGSNMLVRADRLVFGPARTLGRTLVAFPRTAPTTTVEE